MEVRQTDDPLAALNGAQPLADKLRSVQKVVRERLPGVERISVALYDPALDLIKTYVECDGDGPVLRHYEARLAECASLRRIAEEGRPRVVDDVEIFAGGGREHADRILHARYRSSYTMAMYLNGALLGFVFFNSRERAAFDEQAMHVLNVFGHLLGLLIATEIGTVRTLAAVVKTIREVAQHRDVETGAHLNRMAHYARLIARRIADRHGLTDEYIERVFLFSPLHDIGKIGVPDRVLLKQGALTAEELVLMRAHASKGREIIDSIVDDFGLQAVEHIEMLRNIAELHHESVDGSGYPNGLSGAEIPVEARIIAVADVFDALTSARPYKRAWSNAEAIEALRRLAGQRLDADCVQALVDSPGEISEIQARFAEEPYG